MKIETKLKLLHLMGRITDSSLFPISVLIFAIFFNPVRMLSDSIDLPSSFVLSVGASLLFLFLIDRFFDSKVSNNFLSELPDDFARFVIKNSKEVISYQHIYELWETFTSRKLNNNSTECTKTDFEKQIEALNKALK